MEELYTFKGLPFRGEPPVLKDGDRVQPQLMSSTQVGVFLTDNEEDMKEYCRVCDMALRKLCQITVDEREWEPDKGHWRILVRWHEMYYKMPEEEKERIAE